VNIHMYRNPEEESAAAAGRIAEHNRIVGLFEGPEGQADARAAHEFWVAEFNRLSNSETHRMSEIAAGLAGDSATVPWMQDVGYLTEEDRKELMEFKRQEYVATPRVPDDLKPDPELAKLQTELAARQTEERENLARLQEQESATLSAPSEFLEQRQWREREQQTHQFERERERYVREYLEAQRLARELEQKERGKVLDPGKGFSG
jgi:hypothetical protein